MPFSTLDFKPSKKKGRPVNICNIDQSRLYRGLRPVTREKKKDMLYCGQTKSASRRRPKFVRSRAFPPLKSSKHWPPLTRTADTVAAGVAVAAPTHLRHRRPGNGDSVCIQRVPSVLIFCYVPEYTHNIFVFLRSKFVNILFAFLYTPLFFHFLRFLKKQHGRQR